MDFRAVRSAKEPASRAGWFGPSLRKRRVSGRAFGAFSVVVCCFRVWGGRGGGLAAAIIAYEVAGLAAAGGVEAVVEGAGAGGIGATGLDLISLVYMPLI